MTASWAVPVLFMLMVAGCAATQSLVRSEKPAANRNAMAIDEMGEHKPMSEPSKQASKQGKIGVSIGSTAQVLVKQSPQPRCPAKYPECDGSDGTCIVIGAEDPWIAAGSPEDVPRPFVDGKPKTAPNYLILYDAGHARIWCDGDWDGEDYAGEHPTKTWTLVGDGFCKVDTTGQKAAGCSGCRSNTHTGQLNNYWNIKFLGKLHLCKAVCEQDVDCLGIQYYDQGSDYKSCVVFTSGSDAKENTDFTYESGEDPTRSISDNVMAHTNMQCFTYKV